MDLKDFNYFEWDDEEMVVIFNGVCVSDKEGVEEANRTFKFITNSKLKEQLEEIKLERQPNASVSEYYSGYNRAVDDLNFLLDQKLKNLK